MDAGAHRRFRYDDGMGVGEKADNLRREVVGVVRVPDDARRRIAQHAQSAGLHGRMLVRGGVKHVVAAAQKREMIVGEPFEEGDRLVQLRGLDRRRVALELVGRFAELLQHRAPVGDGDRDVGEDAARAFFDRHEARGVALARDGDGDHRFTALAGRAARALGVNDGMKGGGDREALKRQLSKDRIEEERLVIVDRDEDSPVIGEAVGFQGRGEDPHQRLAGRARRRELAAEIGQPRQRRRGEGGDVFRRRCVQEIAGERGGGRAAHLAREGNGLVADGGEVSHVRSSAWGLRLARAGLFRPVIWIMV